MNNTKMHSVVTLQRDLGAMLKKTRLRKNLTQKSVALDSGLTIYVVGQVERGESTVESLIRYLMALGMTEIIEDIIQQSMPPKNLKKLSSQERQRATRQK